MDIQRHEHVVPLFSGLGTAAGVLREIRNAKQSGSTLEEIPMSTIMKGGLLGAGVGLAADLALLGMTARRGQERKRSGPSGGHYRGVIDQTRPHTPCVEAARAEGAHLCEWTEQQYRGINKMLTQRRKAALKKHAAHHTRKHLEFMRRRMSVNGDSFSEAHRKALKHVGK